MADAEACEKAWENNNADDSAVQAQGPAPPAIDGLK